MKTTTQFYHSVYLDPKYCEGCINCIKRCPTRALRVRNGMARVISQYCIDCGECIRHCPHNAKKTRRKGLETMEQFKYKVALPPPELYSQFNNVRDTNLILTALKRIGFDDVFEVSGAAELVSEETRKYVKNNKDKWPIISTHCPSVTRLIRVRFPSLVEHLLPVRSPQDVAAELARQKAMRETGLPSEDIGIFFISPCPSKIANVVDPIGLDESQIDVGLAIKDIYPKLLAALKDLDEDEVEDLAISGRIGVGWGISGGESAGLFTFDYLASDGIENVINVLEDLEDEKISNQLKFIEPTACSGGCVGGTLNVENPYIATSKNHYINKDMPISVACEEDYEADYKLDFAWETPIEYIPVYQLSESITESMAKMLEREEILEDLPKLDCGSCGAPTCKTFAEDVVRGFAKKEGCIYLMRNEYKELLKRSQLLNKKKAEDREKKIEEEKKEEQKLLAKQKLMKLKMPEE